MPLDVVATLQALVRIPSVNPMGRDDESPHYFEGRVTDWLQNLFALWGLPWERQPVHPGRENILVRLEGDASDGEPPLLLWEVHQDTVPIEGMTIPPFDAAERDGRIHGRGACDVKGTMAAMLTALRRLQVEAQRSPQIEARAGRRPEALRGRPTIVLACTINEEHGFTGATHLCQSWSNGQSKLLPRRPDAAIIAEPTELNVVVAHKGVVRWRLRTSGRACHSSDPSRGDSAIYRMGRVLGVLDGYATSIVPSLAEHPRVGRPTLSVGTIAGGLSVNTVPAACSIEIDRRLIPGENPQAAFQHVQNFLATRLPGDVPHITHDPPFIISAGLNDTNNGPLAASVLAALARRGHQGELLGVPFGTDATATSGVGVPSIVFGPGSIAQAHTADEWIAVDQLKESVEVLVDLGGTFRKTE